MDKKLFLLLFACLLFFSCEKDNIGHVTTLTVASEQGTGLVVGLFPCYIVKYEGSDKWTTMTEYIKGFDYEPGYEYVIKVVKEELRNPPQDHLGSYQLIKIISKVKKNSENLPPPAPWEQ